MTNPFVFATLLVEEDEQGIVCCTFNRPAVHNALNLRNGAGSAPVAGSTGRP